MEQSLRLLIGLFFYWVFFWLLVADKSFLSTLSHGWPFLVILFGLDTLRLGNDKPEYSFKSKKGNITKSSITLDKMVRVRIIACVALAAASIGMFVVFPYTQYTNLHNMVKVSSAIQQDKISLENIIVVDEDAALYKVGGQKGTIPNSSMYDVGEASMVKINKKLYWVVSLRLNGIVSNSNAKGQIPGYFLVSATDKDAQAEFVPYNMLYTADSFFEKNVYRMVRAKYTEAILYEGNIEPSDDLKSAVVAVSYGHYNILRNGMVVDGVITVDPQTGEIYQYKINEVPTYIEQVMPSDIAEKYNKYFGEFRGGWFNCIFGSRDKINPTAWGSGKEVVGVYDENGNFNWFTDFTVQSNSGQSKSMIGYSMIDGRTGELKYYERNSNGQSAYNGKAAVDAVNAMFVKEAYTASVPTLYNIYGSETWVMGVNDKTGKLVKIAMVDAKTNQVATGDSKEESAENYKSLLVNIGAGNSVNPSSLAELKTATIKVYRHALDDVNKNVMVWDENMKGYIISWKTAFSNASIYDGDILQIQYIDNGEDVIAVKTVKNLTLEK
jgi:hypothetical protein